MEFDGISASYAASLHPSPLPMNIQSQLRASLAGLAAVGTYLAANQWITPGDAQPLNDAGDALVNPLAGFLAVLAAAAARALMGWIGRKIAARRAEKSA